MIPRQLVLLLGTALAVAGAALGVVLAGEAGSPGAVGFPLLLALPGVALVARATDRMTWRRLLLLVSLATLLLGLDVTDSARPVVVASGWAVALASGLACALLLWAHVAERRGERLPASQGPS